MTFCWQGRTRKRTSVIEVGICLINAPADSPRPLPAFAGKESFCGLKHASKSVYLPIPLAMFLLPPPPAFF